MLPEFALNCLSSTGCGSGAVQRVTRPLHTYHVISFCTFMSFFFCYEFYGLDGLAACLRCVDVTMIDVMAALKWWDGFYIFGLPKQER